MNVRMPKSFPPVTPGFISNFWLSPPGKRDACLRDLNSPWAMIYWLHVLGRLTRLDIYHGVTWTYSPSVPGEGVAAWVLRDSHGKEFWVTDWLPEFEGLTRPHWSEGRVSVPFLSSNSAEALHATLLEVCR